VSVREECGRSVLAHSPKACDWHVRGGKERPHALIKAKTKLKSEFPKKREGRESVNVDVRLREGCGGECVWSPHSLKVM
jgi:hypothetical protein